MLDPLTLAAVVVGAAVGGGLALSTYFTRKRRRRDEKVYKRSVEMGTREVATLHPRIDEHVCICTGACVTVCPEKDVLGMIDGKPTVIQSTTCIGHGERFASC